MTEEIGNVNLGQFTLGATFSRQTYKHEGVCTYVSKDTQFNTINLDQYNKEKDLEICALKLHLLHCSTNFGRLNVTVNWIYYLYVFWAAEYENDSKIHWLALVFEIIALS